MPTSVRLALWCLSAGAAVFALTTLRILATEGEVAWLLVILLAANGIAVYGIALGKRLAWGNARLLTAAFGGLTALGLALLAWLALDELVRTISAVGQTPVVFSRLRNFDFLSFLVVGAAVSASYWAAFVSLGRLSARRYFDRVCPACGSTKIKVASRRPLVLRCRQCPGEW
ncbi:hypothetical protein KOR34_34860 [Posidoniimonas corsicana]|uniref:Uncharacterized protein n=2 Tax=Posidoniimonas corsicana TaxID=1938618 RepID=A0A5C5V6T2_9BACT|nr:hypothetical protein KOR34_34860 [Posidoniimonas corsicana]